MCRRAAMRALKCGAPARWTILRLEPASALVAGDRKNAVGWVKHGPRPTRRTKDAIVQGRDVCLTEYTPAHVIVTTAFIRPQVTPNHSAALASNHHVWPGLS